MSAARWLALAAWVYLLAGTGGSGPPGPALARHGRPCRRRWMIVVPARDEAESIERCLRSLLAQDYAGALRIILVDDRSSDGTGGIARALGDAALLVLDGAARPPGWSGKLWAVAQGVRRGHGAAGAAVRRRHRARPGPCRDAGRQAGGRPAGPGVRDGGAELRQRGGARAGAGLRVLLPVALPVRLGERPATRTAAAAGGTVLVRRTALARIGGIEAVRGALIDDVALATAVKRGGRSGWAIAGWRRSIRPYPAAGDVWRMVARTAYVQLRFSPLDPGGHDRRAGAGLAGAAVARAVRQRVRALGWAAAAWAASAASYLPTLRRFRQSPLWALACRRSRRSTWRPRSARRWTTIAAAAWCGSAGPIGEAVAFEPRERWRRRPARARTTRTSRSARC